MCERRDSIRAVSDAADELLIACTNGRARSFREAVDQTAANPVPADFTKLIGEIDRHDRRKGKRHAGRH
jgi:hypothetical protein